MALRRPRLLVVALLGTLVVAGQQTPSLAAFASADPIGSQTAVAAFSFTGDELDCSPEAVIHEIFAGGFEDEDKVDLEAAGFVIDDPNDGGTITFSVADLPGGQYLLGRRCPGEEADNQVVTFQFSRLLLVKQIQGPPPATPEFVATVVCLTGRGEDEKSVFPGPSETRTFMGEGDHQVILYGPEGESSIRCSVTETQTSGATSVVVDPDELSWHWDPEHPTFGFEDQTSTITNTFPAPKPVTQVDDTVEEAEPADPVEVEPDFTG